MLGKNRKKPPEAAALPRHIGVIMDGNGRWAQKRGLPRSAGHSAGAKTFEDICRHANSLGINTMTFYAFSTENWKRPKEEVDALMRIFKEYLKRMEQFTKENMPIRFTGDLTVLDPELQAMMRQAEEGSASFTGMAVNVAVNYGGRDEILHAVRRLARRVREEEIDPAALTQQDVENALYTAGSPPVDLLIRPGGEFRISNFLLWQTAYAELYFCDTLWPDFNARALDRALAWYAGRNRRFGGI